MKFSFSMAALFWVVAGFFQKKKADKQPVRLAALAIWMAKELLTEYKPSPILTWVVERLGWSA